MQDATHTSSATIVPFPQRPRIAANAVGFRAGDAVRITRPGPHRNVIARVDTVLQLSGYLVVTHAGLPHVYSLEDVTKVVP